MKKAGLDGGFKLIKEAEVPTKPIHAENGAASPALERSTPNAFFISGQVGKPGIIVIPEGQPLTVSMAVTLAGGGSRLADLGKVQLHRLDATGATKTIIVDVKKALEGKATPVEDPVVLPGDKINVPESQF